MTGLALEADGAAQQLDQLARNRQAQAVATVSALDVPVGLREAAEDA